MCITIAWSNLLSISFIKFHRLLTNLWLRMETSLKEGQSIDKNSSITEIKHQIKLGPYASSWEELFKGVLQGSISGPLLFNVFINDIFYFIVQSILYNYADDNTLSFIHKVLLHLKSVLEQESQILISWFDQNLMKANPDKFQVICIGKKTHDNIESFQIGQTNIKCDDSVTLLGINIDYMLKFDAHVSEICKKASKQLAVLKRLGGFLTKQGKLVIYNSFIASNFATLPLFGIFVVHQAQTN